MAVKFFFYKMPIPIEGNILLKNIINDDLSEDEIKQIDISEGNRDKLPFVDFNILLHELQTLGQPARIKKEKNPFDIPEFLEP